MKKSTKIISVSCADGILGAVIAGAGMVAVGGAAVLIGLFAKRK